MKRTDLGNWETAYRACKGWWPARKIDMRAAPEVDAAPRDERRPGHTKLVYDKATHTIVTKSAPRIEPADTIEAVSRPLTVLTGFLWWLRLPREAKWLLQADASPEAVVYALRRQRRERKEFDASAR